MRFACSVATRGGYAFLALEGNELTINSNSLVSTVELSSYGMREHRQYSKPSNSADGQG